MQGENAFDILRRLVETSQGSLSTAAAKAVLDFSFTEADHARLAELAEKSNSGLLTPEDGAEYDSYIATADLISIWKAKARLALKQQPTAA